eukprot:GFUD01031039.1.p1 GENE.GFUD01031039.1~~GFUD01031039.1.p1  ORF type:complete len:647 (-),score=115.24 GFUD01031039.1:694-2634(-)
MISPDINANTGTGIMGDNAPSSELQKLQDKVRALEQQNALLKQNQPLDSVDGAELTKVGDNLLSKMSGGKSSSPPNAAGERIEDVKLIDIESLEGSEGNWLISMDQDDFESVDEIDWLRRDVESPSAMVAIKKKSLVNKLEDLARRSPSHSLYNYGSQVNGSRRHSSSLNSSPLKSYASSTPSSKYAAPSRGQNFDPRTFTRPPGAKAGAYSLPPEEEDLRVRKSSYHRLAFGSQNGDSNQLNATFDQLEISDVGADLTYSNSGENVSTFNKTSELCLTNNHCDADKNVLNSTFDKVGAKDGLNSTFTRGASMQAFNSTFNRTNPESTVLNTTFEKEIPGEHRKMSEDRLSSTSSSCDGGASNRLSRESSQDILVEDIDRLSTTSAMSESSVSHRLNDVQDVQDIARMQEENTISPLSEQSLSSPVEDVGGYQSEESCGSESGVVRNGPRRGEVQYGYGSREGYQGNGQYSSQDSLPDSPYSSQSLDSHASQGGPDVRRSMPNLNKLRGAKNGAVVPNPQYGLSQARYHNSDSRLQPPGSRLQGPSHLAAPSRTLRAPSSGLVRPNKISSGLRPPGSASTGGQERKLSGIARPAGQGIPRPGQSRLQAPGQYQRRGISRGVMPTRGGTSRITAPRTGNQNWMEDCY